MKMIDFQKDPIVGHYDPDLVPRARFLSIAGILRRGMKWNRCIIGGGLAIG